MRKGSKILAIGKPRDRENPLANFLPENHPEKFLLRLESKRVLPN
jgi:hypothetical protein